MAIVFVHLLSKLGKEVGRDIFHIYSSYDKHRFVIWVIKNILSCTYVTEVLPLSDDQGQLHLLDWYLVFSCLLAQVA